MKTKADLTQARALLVDLSTKFGGASARAADIVRAAEPLEWALAVLQDSPALEHARANGVRCHIVGARRASPGIISRLERVIRSDEYQIVDAQNPQSKLWGSLAAWHAGACYVSTLNSWPLSEYGPSLRGYAYTYLEKLTRRRTHMYVAVSEDIQSRLHKSGVPPSMTTFIPAAIDFDNLSSLAVPDDLKSQLAIPSDAPVITAVGRLVRAKGYYDLIAAFAQIARQFPEPHCLIIGDGPERQALQVQIEKAGLDERLHLLGFVPRNQALRIVAASDLFVMLALSEGTPVALIEAAGLSRPIVATNVGGIPQMLDDGVHARIIPPEDYRALAAGITELLAHPDFAAGLGEQAKAHVHENFNLAQQVRSTRRAYQQAQLNYQLSLEIG